MKRKLRAWMELMMCLPSRNGCKASKQEFDAWLVVSSLVDTSDVESVYHSCIIHASWQYLSPTEIYLELARS